MAENQRFFPPRVFIRLNLFLGLIFPIKTCPVRGANGLAALGACGAPGNEKAPGTSVPCLGCSHEPPWALVSGVGDRLAVSRG